MLHITYLSGLVPNMDEIIDICKKNNLILIEDISQAYGANYKGKLCGTFGDASIGSFSLGKTISSNGGGVVIINNAKLEDKFNKLFEDSLNLPSKLFLLKINFNQLIIKFLTSRIIFNFFTFYLFRFIKKFFRNTFNDPEMKNKIFLNINRKNYYKNIPEIRQKFPEILFKKMSDSQCQLAQECFDNLDVNNKKIRNLANLYIKKLNKKFTNNIPKSAYNIPQNTFLAFSFTCIK